MFENRADRAVKLKKTTRFLLAMVALAAAVGGVILALHWPFSQQRISQSLQETFPAIVTFQKFHATYFPHPGCVGEGVVFRRLGSFAQTPPIVTIQHLEIEAHYLDLFFRPGYLARIVGQGFQVHVPPAGTSLQETNWKETTSNTRVGEIVLDGSVIEIARAGAHASLLFEIHTLKLMSVSRDKPLSYNVSLHNPLPPGEIRARGQFGP